MCTVILHVKFPKHLTQGLSEQLCCLNGIFDKTPAWFSLAAVL